MIGNLSLLRADHLSRREPPLPKLPSDRSIELPSAGQRGSALHCGEISRGNSAGGIFFPANLRMVATDLAGYLVLTE